MIWRNDSSIFLFDSHNKDENGNLSSSSTAVLLKLDTLRLLQSYIIYIYYNSYPLTLYFKVQFIKVDCTTSPKNANKYALKKERLPARLGRDFKKKKYHEDPEKKLQTVKKRYYDKAETIKQCKKQKYLENPISKIASQKAKSQENVAVQLAYKTIKYHENSEKKNKASKSEVPGNSIT